MNIMKSAGASVMKSSGLKQGHGASKYNSVTANQNF
jgi:hypothetical protein